MAWFRDWFDTPYYHLLYGERDEKEAGEFIRKLIAFLNPGTGAVFLDLACGKGRHAFDIASYGFEVFGVDLSVESIAEAKTRSSDFLHFDVHDMRESYKPAYFDFILNLFTSFGYFEDREDNNKALNAIHTDLNKNGIFVQDYFNASKVKADLVPREIKSAGGIQFEINKKLEDQCIIKEISFSVNACNYSFREKVSLFEPEEFRKMYSQAGFEILNTFGDYNLKPFDPDCSDRLILISKKL